MAAFLMMMGDMAHDILLVTMSSDHRFIAAFQKGNAHEFFQARARGVGIREQPEWRGGARGEENRCMTRMVCRTSVFFLVVIGIGHLYHEM